MGATGFSYADRFMAPLKVNKLYMTCENTYIADVPAFGILPKSKAGDAIDYQTVKVVQFG